MPAPGEDLAIVHVTQDAVPGNDGQSHLNSPRKALAIAPHLSSKGERK